MYIFAAGGKREENL